MTGTETKPAPVFFAHKGYHGALYGEPISHNPSQVRIDLGVSSDFTRKGWGKKVKALGGRYSEARGDAGTRYVHLPVTKGGIDLADQLIKEFGSHSFSSKPGMAGFVFDHEGGNSLPSWVHVHYAKLAQESPTTAAIELFRKALLSAVNRDIIVGVTEEMEKQEQARLCAEKLAAARKEIPALKASLRAAEYALQRQERYAACEHARDNQGLCHSCGILMDRAAWEAYAGPVPAPKPRALTDERSA